MMRKLMVIVLVLSAIPSALAQQPVPVKKGNKVMRFLVGPWKAMFTDWRFAATIAPMAAGIWLDCHSTALVQRRRPGAVELNPFLPEHPSARHLVPYCGAYFAGQTYVAWGVFTYAKGIKGRKSYEPYLWTGAYSGGVGAIHGVWGARLNYNLITCPSGSFKPPGSPGCVVR